MITMPYVNFAELSKERDDNHVENNLPSTLCKNGDKITIKLKDGNILSGTFNGYWGEDNDDGLFIDDYAISDSEIVDIIRNDIDNQINEVLRLAGVQLNERENLTGFNRIAGFWNYAKEEFYFFPRTTEELDPNDDEIVQYIHNNPSKDYFTEHKVVRFGIENIPGEGVVCYIEGDTKSHAYDCYYTIIDEYQEEYDIIKYEVEYYVGNSKRMDEYDAYGNQIMEYLNESVISEQVPKKLYYATFSKLLRKIKKCGYLGNSPYKSWSDSNNKYVYLSTDPDKAYSYAETTLDDCNNERLYDMLEDDDIVILEIDTKYLDKNKLFRDENVVDGETTYQYKGIINCQIMKIYKPTLDESVENVYILKNPTRNELKRYNIDKWRLLQDIDGNYYFADSFQYTHDMMSNKLRSIGISAVDANTDNCGIILYNALTNTFYYRLLDIIDYEDVEEEYNKSYLSKEFSNADLSQSYDDVEELDESVGGNYFLRSNI